MTIAPDQLHRQRFATPRGNRSVLALPPMEEAGNLAQENARLRGERHHTTEQHGLEHGVPAALRSARAACASSTAAATMARCLPHQSKV